MWHVLVNLLAAWLQLFSIFIVYAVADAIVYENTLELAASVAVGLVALVSCQGGRAGSERPSGGLGPPVLLAPSF